MATNKDEFKTAVDKMKALRKDYADKAKAILESGTSGHETTFRILSHKAQAVKECLDIIESTIKGE